MERKCLNSCPVSGADATGACAVALETEAHHEAAIRFAGREYRPDESVAWFTFRYAYAFPVGMSVYGDVMLPDVVRRSAHSLVNKPVDLEHKMKAFAPQEIHRDRILGFHREVEVVEQDGLPHIHALGGLFKRAEGVDRILGQHGSGRKPWTVSLEFKYRVDQSGFLVGRQEGDARHGSTPAWLEQYGWDYVPVEFDGRRYFIGNDHFDGLGAVRDFRTKSFVTRHASARFAGDWRGRPVYFAMGGLNSEGHFRGTGVVENGAELTAHIGEMLAADTRVADLLTPAVAGARRLAEVLNGLKKV